MSEKRSNSKNKSNKFHIRTYETLILTLFLVVTIGYIIFLKSSDTQTIFVKAAIEKPDWWQSTAQMPSELLSTVGEGDYDVSKTLKIIELKYFISQEPNWEVNVTDRVVGRAQFEIQTRKQNGRIYYNDQELLIGNPLVVIVEKTRMELLITDVQENRIESNYVKKRVVVKIFDKYLEQVAQIKSGLEIKDNDDFIYAKILNVKLEHSSKTTVDQWGKTLLQKDPLKYDAVVEIETLATVRNGRITGYDGRTISIGRNFIINSERIDDIGGYIIDIF